MNLAKIGIRGAYFTSLALGFRQVISLCTTFYVARNLLPQDIGLFSLVMTVIGFAQVLGDIGIASGIVQSQDESESVLSTSFWIGCGIGAVLSLAVFLMAPFAGTYYKNMLIVPFLEVSAMGLILNFATQVPLAILQQRLAYKQIAMSQSLGSMVGAFSAIAFVSSGFGVWGLVVQPIVGNMLLIASMMYFSNWRPRLIFKMSSVSRIVRNGFHLLISGIFNYVRNTFDVVVIGGKLPPENIGLYGLAQTILYAPMHLITSTISRVIFPILAKVQNNHEELKYVVLASSSRAALLIFPVYFGMIILADEVVLCLFGEKWNGMVPLIRIMSISFIVQSIGNVISPLLIAIGKARAVMMLSLAGALGYFLILLFLIPYGITAVAIGYATANTIFGMMTISMTVFYARISLSSYIVCLFRPFMIAAAMSAVVFLSKYYFPQLTITAFIFHVLSGVISFLILIYIFEFKTLKTIFYALKNS